MIQWSLSAGTSWWWNCLKNGPQGGIPPEQSVTSSVSISNCVVRVHPKLCFAASTGQSFPFLVISGNWRVKLSCPRQSQGGSQGLLYSAVSWLASLFIFSVCGQAQLYMCVKREDGAGGWSNPPKFSLKSGGKMQSLLVHRSPCGDSRPADQVLTFPLLYKIERFGELCDRAP